jgi:hypothetical protein
VNAGGAAYTDSSGQNWAADSAYSGGAPWIVPNGIANTGAPGLYQTCRYGNFSYNFAVPNGTYNVTLKFAEVSRFGPGRRMFHVTINGSVVLSNFDIFAQAGGVFIALDKVFPVTASNGQIVVQFSSGAADLPMVNGIQISAASQSASSSGIRIDAGGNSYTDASGSTWSADTLYSGGSTWSVANSIAATGNPALYQTCRYGNFSYDAAVPNGIYTVTLQFAEISVTGPGQRVFNVAINGSQVLGAFDIFAQAGGMFTALDKTFTVSVTNGQLSIQFTSGSANLPMVNAIQIVPSA